MPARKPPKLIALIGAAVLSLTAHAAWTQTLDTMTLHGFCGASAATTTCFDNGTITPTSQNPLSPFGFTRSPDTNSGLVNPDFILVALLPTNQGATFGSFTGIAGVSGTQSLALFSSTPFSDPNQQLANYLGQTRTGGPNDQLSAFLAGETNQGVSGVNQFFVYTADFGSVDFVTADPVFSSTTVLPNGTELLGLVECSSLTGVTQPNAACPSLGAVEDGTAPSSTIIDVGKVVVPEPASLALFGTALAGLGLLGRRRRSRKNG